MDDTRELPELRIKQTNLIGPVGYISMEGTEATELADAASAFVDFAAWLSVFST